jgi:hypothetical protein
MLVPITKSAAISVNFTDFIAPNCGQNDGIRLATYTDDSARLVVAIIAY